MSNIPHYQPIKSSVSTQQGAVLIVVLLFLVLIILVGAIAVKQSTTNLRLATSDQINTLLLQSADNANQNMEQGVNGSSDADVYTDMLSRTGPFGHFILDTNSAEHEYVFCFRPRGRFFDINKTTINTGNGGNILGNEAGYCNPSTPADYVSDRNASMTQVNISLTAPSANNELFSNYTIGQDSSEISSQAFMFDLNTTAILPAYSGKTDAAKDCFKKTSRVGTVANAKDAIGGCMIEESVPSTVLYEVANVENLSLRENCVDFGKGKGVVCTLPTS
ncbi:PilX N-terminal domain-containing pilus assembly protein [Psychrobacter sp. DAB_AL43B]|uniref:PilX N-terminal domain-containing pilus assembly protein n=1 Tax=Psychrobacter sp. DAB_AL43B TaxID=1028416 RepID=UPI0009A855DE|nr:PilX N-terminal domain-containing pilus assembly protein [Psychrobacter sp. DAB_AL43B]SLJ83531.1 putative pilus assembly protein PilX [Psychrobacter sp. DAB_AL43B]